MVKIKVWRLRDIIYKFVFLFFVVVILSLLLRFIISTVKINSGDAIYIKYYKANMEKPKVGMKLIESQLPLIRTLEIDDKKIIQEREKININTGLSEIKEFEVEEFSLSRLRVGDININSYCEYDMDESILKMPSEYRLPKKASILIYHTHTSESYTKGVNDINYNQTDYFRTENEEYNITKVGETLARFLKDNGMKVIQDKTSHDYPSYNGAYKSSLQTVEKQLKNNKFDMMIDVHRDALASNANFRPTTEINGESVARLMFVVGTDAMGLEHPNWMENLRFAILVQTIANKMYPGLFRDLHLSSSRYNQHTSNATLILEVGATGNTLEEAQRAVKYFAEVIERLVE